MSQDRRYSFEFFPTKTDAGHEKLMATAKQLASYNPDFFSCTYGAGGSTRDRTINTVLQLESEVKVPAAPHLSCVGDSKADLRGLLTQYKAAGITRIVLASTAAIYGDALTGPVSEQTAPALRSPYAASKLAAEQALQNCSCETVSLRLFNVFGPGLDDSLVARLERSTVDEPARLRTLDDFVRDYVHSDDVARAVEAAIVRPLPERHTVLNVGSGVPTSNRAVLEAVSARQPVHWQLVAGPPSYSVADMSLAGSVLGFVPPVRL